MVNFVFFCNSFCRDGREQNSGRKKIKWVLKKYHDFISSLLTAGKKEGFFPSDYNVPLNAYIVIAIHSGILLQWFMNRKEVDGPMLARTYRNSSFMEWC
jgi:hypothetical protein